MKAPLFNKIVFIFNIIALKGYKSHFTLLIEKVNLLLVQNMLILNNNLNLDNLQSISNKELNSINMLKGVTKE